MDTQCSWLRYRSGCKLSSPWRILLSSKLSHDERGVKIFTCLSSIAATVAGLRTPCYRNSRSRPFRGSDRTSGPRLRRPLLQPRGPDLHLSRVPANTEAISNPSAPGACANFPLFLHAFPPISARNGAYGLTSYERAPPPAFNAPAACATQPALERA